MIDDKFDECTSTYRTSKLIEKKERREENNISRRVMLTVECTLKKKTSLLHMRNTNEKRKS